MSTNWLEEQFSLDGKVALVTGASKGIGAEIAISMALAGADLILMGRSEKSLGQTAKKISEISSEPQEIHCDLSDLAELEKAIVELESKKIDVLVNNAGTIFRSPTAEMPDDEWHRLMDINVNSVFSLTKQVGRGMLERGSGRIINIASLLSFQGGVNVAAYATSKHAIAGFTKALANEWGSKGVNVNAIAPGYIETDNTAPLRQDTKRSESISSRIPMARWGQPDDIAGVAVFLASKAAKYINGEILAVDGGWMAR
jgi:2-deoxy-D-gluconate 3-dehydrogenase